MEIERNQIRKTIFGNYRAEDVEKYLDEAERQLQSWKTERADEAAKISAARSEVENLSAQLQQLQEENLRYQERNQRLGETCESRSDEVRKLREELEDVRKQMESIRTELDLANSQTTILSDRIARQRRELDEKDKLLLADPIEEANKRAEQIIQNATNISQQMIDDAENMRSRALASVRAAYFNTIGFRKNMEEQFSTLQSELDQSVRMLRLIESEDESAIPDYVQEKW